MTDDLSIRADREFFEKARKRSPVFPTIADAVIYRQRAREALAARIMLACIVLGIGYALISGDALGYVGAAIAFLGFVITVIVACTRHHERCNPRP